MRSDRFRVKLWDGGPYIGRFWGVFVIARRGRVSKKPFIISSTVAGALDALARKQRSRRDRSKTHTFNLSDVLAQARRRTVPRGFDH